jgi:ketosteroid isomerase-like protein
LLQKPFEKAQSLPEEILEVGDKIVVFVHFQAWPKGGGQPIEGRIADVYTVQDGKVVQMQAYSDPEEARKAVGLLAHQ